MPFDYEEGKAFFQETLAADLKGKGRVEAALFKTALMIFNAGVMDTGRVVARVERNSAGQIYLVAPDGEHFDMSKYIGRELHVTLSKAEALD